MFALFLFLSCSRTCVSQWEIERVVAACPSGACGKVFYPCQNDYNGLELELTKSLCDVRLYVNIFCFEINPAKQSPPTAQLQVTIRESSFEVDAPLFQGGQRLLIPDEAADLIIEALLAGDSVVLSVARFRAEIPSENFAKVYQELF